MAGDYFPMFFVIGKRKKPFPVARPAISVKYPLETVDQVVWGGGWRVWNEGFII